jgi:hypothetical protein
LVDVRALAERSSTASGKADWAHGELNGKIYRFANASQLEQAEARIEAGEANLGPEPVAASEALVGSVSATDTPAIAAAATTAWTTGAKKVLYIRIDFSDLPGDPKYGWGGSNPAVYTAAYVQNLADTVVSSYFVTSSYGLTSTTNTVTTQLYRMPQTAAYYAANNANSQLHSDAQAAAAANYTISSYDRIVVLFSSLNNITGSKINYGGYADIGARRVWLNGECDFRLLPHELGHTFGLYHAGLWQVTDGNATSANGTGVEYGDPYDTMGSNQANDTRTDYSAMGKNRLGWVTDSQVKTVTANGTYRIYASDTNNAVAAPSAPTLALKVARDSGRSFWISLRRNFTSNSSMQHGACVIWGYNSVQSDTGGGYLSALLDATTPGLGTSDAALAVGASLADSVSGVLIRPLAEGGTSPNFYMDIEVDLRPVITVQPVSVVATIGSPAQLSVSASGALSYQWYKNGTALAGATSATLQISSVSTADAATYHVVITGVGGFTVQSSDVTLSAVPGSAGKLINLSTLSYVGIGGSVQTAGFVIGSGAPKKVLIRAAGPALAPYSIGNLLSDPVLTLISGSTVLNQNDDWSSDPAAASAIAAAADASGAFSWTTGSKDAAMLVALPPGAYTAQVNGKNNTTGMAIVEVYEVDGTAGVGRLINISTRAEVHTGAEIETAGFVIGGTTSKKVLIRASGPALIPYGITNYLADPTLTLFSGSTSIAQNDDWSGADVAAAADASGAFSWTPGSKDAAILITLAPGAYTAQVTGKAGNGIALVEVYEVP